MNRSYIRNPRICNGLNHLGSGLGTMWFGNSMKPSAVRLLPIPMNGFPVQEYYNTSSPWYLRSSLPHFSKWQRASNWVVKLKCQFNASLVIYVYHFKSVGWKIAVSPKLYERQAHYNTILTKYFIFFPPPSVSRVRQWTRNMSFQHETTSHTGRTDKD